MPRQKCLPISTFACWWCRRSSFTLGSNFLGESAPWCVASRRCLWLTLRILLLSRNYRSTTRRINAVFYYSGLFFEGVIDNPLVGTTILGAVNVLATYAAILLMDRFKRRTLIMWSSAGMFLSCVVIVAALQGYFSKAVALGAVASYVSFFEIGLGPIPVSLRAPHGVGATGTNKIERFLLLCFTLHSVAHCSGDVRREVRHRRDEHFLPAELDVQLRRWPRLPLP